MTKPPKADLDQLIRAQLANLSNAGVTREEFDKLSQNVEKLAEDVGQVTYGRDSIKDYIESLTADIVAGRQTRFWLCILSVFMVLAGLLSLLAVIFCPFGQAAFKTIADPHVQIAVVVTLFGLTFGLTALLVKGAFHRGQAADPPDIMPEHVKLFLESVRGK